jgi:hypothetical protein
VDSLTQILAFLLAVLAFLPLLLLGLYLLAEHFGLKGAERIMGVFARALQVQWFLGALLNLVVGVALCALGVWAMLRFDTPAHRLVGAGALPFGLWRAVKGWLWLRGFSDPGDASPAAPAGSLDPAPMAARPAPASGSPGRRRNRSRKRPANGK